MRIAFFFYRITAPLLVLAVKLFGPFFGSKLRHICKERSRRDWFLKKTEALGKPFWIHAASGEIEYARPLIQRLKKTFPTVPIVVTYASPSSIRILQKISLVDAWGISPWDLPGSVRNFLDRVNPRAVFFARTDVWPEMVTQIQARGIPSALFSATFATESSRLKGFSKYLNAWAFSKLDKIFVVSALDEEVLRRAGILFPVVIAGDTRYEQVRLRLENPQPVKDYLRPENGKVFVAGSTWPEDEAVLLPWFAKTSGARLLLAPHEISAPRLNEIEKYLSRSKIGCDFYSKAASWTKPVLILDQVGILAELYSWGTAAFVGGSFKKQVHSVMEPLAAGLPVAVGPFHLNNREATEFQNISINEMNCVTEVKSSSDLDDFWKNAQSLTPSLRQEIKDQIARRQGAVNKVLAWVTEISK